MVHLEGYTGSATGGQQQRAVSRRKTGGEMRAGRKRRKGREKI